MYKLILAIRYFYKRRTSWVALAAVGLCVFIVVVVMTVMSGLVGEFKEKNHSFTGDCVVGTESLVGFPYYEDFIRELNNTNFVEAATPVIKSYALVNAGASQGMGVEIMGIDPGRFSRVTSFGRSIHYHKDASQAFEPTAEPNQPGFVAGIDLWLNRDEKGEYYFEPNPPAAAMTVTCFPLTARGALAKAGTDLANSKTFYFSDCSQTGLARVDGSTIYLPFAEAQLLCGMTEPAKRASWIHIKFKQGVNIDQGCSKVRTLWEQFRGRMQGKENADLLGQASVQGWKEYRRAFVAGMEKEQIMLTAMFGLVGLTTVFIVMVVFYMIVSHKTKDIGILKSIGASAPEVVSLFLTFACLIGTSGSVVGISAGIWFLRNINAIENRLFERFGFQLWDRTIYSIGEIPHRPDLTMLLAVTGCAILACLAGALLPSIQAARGKPAQILQVNQL